MNKKLLILPSVSLIVTALPFLSIAQQSTAVRPNIVFIMADDHAFQAISAYGSGLNSTPNIDRIANEGVIFQNSYVCNSISGPARAALLTGKFSHMNGFRDNGPKAIFDGSQQTFPKLLQQAGYQTAVIGKWHLRSTPTGFDHYSVHVDQGTYYNPEFIEPDGKKQYPGYATDLTLEKSLDWLEHADKQKPFCLMMQFKAPHRSWLPAPEKMTMYEDVTFPLPANFYDNYQGRDAAMQAEMSIDKHMRMDSDLKMIGDGKKGSMPELRRMNAEQIAAFDRVYTPIYEDFKRQNLSGRELAEWKYQRYMRDYMKVISSVDDNVGRMIDYLKQNGLWENTIVIYTSDQGFYLGEHGWFDKRFMYEESFRTPLVISYPNGIDEKVKQTSALVQNVDIAPTLLDFAGVKAPEPMQGESMKPILVGKSESIRDELYYHYYEYPDPHAVKRHYGVRNDRYKLIHFYHDIDTWELYDLKEDPHEMHNLITDPAYAKVKEQMLQSLKRMQIKYEDTNPTNDGYIDTRRL